MMNRFSIAAAAALFLSASGTSAEDYQLGSLVIESPYAFETTKTAQTAGGFMAITNIGETADRLLAVEAAFPRVEIHTTEMDGDIARMIRQDDGVEITPGETLLLEPGSYHVMFMGLRGDPFEVDEQVPATLVFENAGRVDIAFTVKARMASGHGHMDHDEMDHGSEDHAGH